MVGEMPRLGDASDPSLAPGAPPTAPRPAARFCNNCGLAVAADVTVCPDCGSRDIN